MKREWNCRLFGTDLEEDETAASTLAAVAEPRYLLALQQVFEALAENGDKAWIAAQRGKYDAHGNEVTGEDAPGNFRTDGYGLQTRDGDWLVARNEAICGTGPAETLAFELAMDLTPEIIRSLFDIKVILDRFGGQVLISPYVHDEQVLGYIFHYEHISKLGRGKEPDANIAEPLPLIVRGFSETTIPVAEIAPEPVAASTNGTEPDED